MPSKTNEVRAEATNFFSFAVSAMLKPVTTLKDKIKNYNSFKSAGIATLIVAIFATLVSLLATMFSAVLVRKYSFSSGYKTSIDFSNLGEINYFKAIFLNLIIYIAVIAVIALIFFGVSRIFKKPETNYWRMLTVVAIASIPCVIASFLVPILSLLHVVLAALVSIAGSLYSFYIFYEGINAEADITGDKKIYFNLVSTIILVIVAYIIIRLLVEDTAASSGLDLTKMLNF